MGTFKVKNIPIILVYYILPIISAIYTVILGGKGHLDYEVVWIGLWGILCLLSLQQPIRRSVCIGASVILLIFIFKYLLPVIWQKNVVWRAVFVDAKYIYYLLLSWMWVKFVGAPSVQFLYKAGRFLCLFYILYFFIMIVLKGGYSRFELLSESNYDSFLLLIPFCFIQEEKKSRYDYFLFLIAVFLSGSKTGIATICILLFLYNFRNRKYRFLCWIIPPVLVVIFIYVYFMRRGITDVNDVDRFIFFAQFFEYVKDSSWSSVLLGIFPGQAMAFVEVLPSFEWYISKFENMNNILGCYPFYFHSTYIRLAIVWGLPLVIGLIVLLVRIYMKTSYLPMKQLIVLFLIQSISLSSLTLATVSVPFLIVMITVFSKHTIFSKS